MEVADRFGMLASGSSGLQGEWPKVSMTQANDGLYYPDSFVTGDEAVLCDFAEHLRQLPTMAKDFGASPDILEHAMGRCIEITDSVLAACQ